MNKTDLVSNIQKWVAIDTQLKSANEKIRTLREHKHQLTEILCEHLVERTVGISDVSLKVVERNEYKPLTFSYIEDRLHEIITNEEHVASIIKYLRDNRDVNVVRDIRRNVTK
jgi:hypothetical protein